MPIQDLDQTACLSPVSTRPRSSDSRGLSDVGEVRCNEHIGGFLVW
jgi:hypothetical protein